MSWRSALASAAIVTVSVAGLSAKASAADALSVEAATRFANLALTCLHQEYPNHVSHSMESAEDVGAPHDLTPAFYGCLDWHSDVHGHWLLVRLLRLFPNAPFAEKARAEIARSLTPQNMAAEVAYLQHKGRASFERPYGLAWLLALSAELREWNDPQGKQWAATIKPLETEAAHRILDYLPKLAYPIRIGEHTQTAFSLGLIWDWARTTGDQQMRAALVDAAQRYYANDRNCPLSYEPSGEDFLSPCISEADFMRRVLEPKAYATWLTGFLPVVAQDAKKVWLQPGIVTDRSDPKLAHLDGLNLSRAWMLQGIAHGLPAGDKRIASLLNESDIHAQAALPAVTGEYYEGGHWLGTFAVYLTSKAGIK